MSTPTPPPPEGSSPDVPVTPAPVTPPPMAPMAVPVGTTPAGVPVFANGKPAVNEYGQPVSPKSRLAAALLAWFLGIFGIHRFYVGKVGTGIAMIFTLGGLGIWVLVDFIMILVGPFRDKEGLVLNNW